MLQIKNSKGEVIKLTQQEQRISNYNMRKANALGYNINVPLLTTVLKQVQEQKFFQVAPADFIPMRVGEGAWSTHLLSFRTFDAVDDFETGLINTGGGDTRLAGADAGVDAVTVPIFNWAKEIGWSLPELQHSLKAGNFDILLAKESARKRNWDLGIQKVAFLGTSSGLKGLLNQAGITNNTTRITKPIGDMTAAELTAFIGGILNDYRVNNNRTAWPSVFAIPESDYLKLATPTSDTYPIKSKLELLMDTFRIMTGNPNFKVLSLPYGDSAYNGLGVQRYALYNADDQSLRMDIPVDYTSTQQSSINGFMFHNVGYGQFSGVQAYRPQELLYFSY